MVDSDSCIAVAAAAYLKTDSSPYERGRALEKFWAGVRPTRLFLLLGREISMMMIRHPFLIKSPKIFTHETLWDSLQKSFHDLGGSYR